MAPVADDPKRELRARVRALRCGLDADACVTAAERLAERLLALPELVSARVVLAYGASAEEIDPWPTIDVLRERGARIAYPRIEQVGELALHVLDSEAELVAGPFGIREPAASSPRISAEEVDVVLVPGVAFDCTGHRLGYGGGYYDRLLPLLADAVCVGIAYDEQLVDTIPHEPHDVRVDLVVTPSGIVRCE